jgi:hypothetical protein
LAALCFASSFSARAESQVAAEHAAAEHAATESAPVATAAPVSSEVRLLYDADEPSRLVSVMVTRLSAELRVSGFSVVLPANSDATNESAPEGYADVRVSEQGERVRLEVSSRSPSASSRVVLTGTEREIGPLALQAVEFLRAGQVPRVEALPRPKLEKPKREEPPTPLPKPPQPASWFMDVGATLLTSYRVGDRLALLSLATGYAWPERAALGASLDVPMNSPSFQGAQGVAEYRLWLGSLYADYAWLRWDGGELRLGPEAGLARVIAEGRPNALGSAVSPELWALSLGARLSGEVRVSSLVALDVHARVLGLSPNPVVAVASDERRLGSPSLLFGIAVRLGGRGGVAESR